MRHLNQLQEVFDTSEVIKQAYEKQFVENQIVEINKHLNSFVLEYIYKYLNVKLPMLYKLNPNELPKIQGINYQYGELVFTVNIEGYLNSTISLCRISEEQYQDKVNLFNLLETNLMSFGRIIRNELSEVIRQFNTENAGVSELLQNAIDGITTPYDFLDGKYIPFLDEEFNIKPKLTIHSNGELTAQLLSENIPSLNVPSRIMSNVNFYYFNHYNKDIVRWTQKVKNSVMNLQKRAYEKYKQLQKQELYAEHDSRYFNSHKDISELNARNYNHLLFGWHNVYMNIFIDNNMLIRAIKNKMKYPNIDFIQMRNNEIYDLDTNEVNAYASAEQIREYLRVKKKSELNDIFIDVDSYESLKYAIKHFNDRDFNIYVYESSNYQFFLDGKTYTAFFIRNRDTKSRQGAFFCNREPISKLQMLKAKRAYRKASQNSLL